MPTWDNTFKVYDFYNNDFFVKVVLTFCIYDEYKCWSFKFIIVVEKVMYYNSF